MLRSTGSGRLIALLQASLQKADMLQARAVSKRSGKGRGGHTQRQSWSDNAAAAQRLQWPPPAPPLGLLLPANRKKKFIKSFAVLGTKDIASCVHSDSRELAVDLSMKIVAARHFLSLGLALPVLARCTYMHMHICTYVSEGRVCLRGGISRYCRLYSGNGRCALLPEPRVAAIDSILYMHIIYTHIHTQIAAVQWGDACQCVHIINVNSAVLMRRRTSAH